MGGEEDPVRFRKEDLVAWYRVWDQTQIARAAHVLDKNKAVFKRELFDQKDIAVVKSKGQSSLPLILRESAEVDFDLI